MTSILIAGPPGVLCDEAERRVIQVADAHGLNCCIERVSDFASIIELQVFAIPGLVVDGVLRSVGRVPEITELVDWLDLHGDSATQQAESESV